MARAKAKTSRPQWLVCDNGVRKKPSADRGPKLIAAITDATKAGKDKDYVAKLGTFSLPRLVDLATSTARRARA